MPTSYRYLAESIRTFPDQETLAGMMERAGLRARAGAQPLRRHRRDPQRLAAVSLAGKRVLLIVSGGIAAYKALELIRLLRARGLRRHLRADRGRRRSSSPRCRCRR